MHRLVVLLVFGLCPGVGQSPALFLLHHLVATLVQMISHLGIEGRGRVLRNKNHHCNRPITINLIIAMQIYIARSS